VKIMDNALLDAKVLASVREGQRKAAEILRDVSRSSTLSSQNPLYRPVDRSLQRLSRKRLIRFLVPGGWSAC